MLRNASDASRNDGRYSSPPQGEGSGCDEFDSVNGREGPNLNYKNIVYRCI